MKVHHYHPTTGVYLGATDARPDPLELETARAATRDALTAAAETAHVAALAAAEDAAAREAAEAALRAAAMAAQTAALAVEPTVWMLPAHATFEPPPEPGDGEVAVWRDGGWTVAAVDADDPATPSDAPPADPAGAVRAERDRRINALRWLVERHADEIALARPTTLSAAQHLDVLTHIQALRQTPEQPGFPDAVDWPALPSVPGL